MKQMNLNQLLGAFLFFIFLIPSFSARAAYFLSGDVYYSSDAFTYTTATTSGATFWSMGLNLGLGNSKKFSVGWNVLGISRPETDTASSTFSSSDMGLRFGWNLSRGGAGWLLAVTYNIKATGSYDGSGQAETLKGTSLLAEIGYVPLVSESWNAGMKLCYYAPSFTESLIGATTYSVVSYSRTMIFPTFAFGFNW